MNNPGQRFSLALFFFLITGFSFAQNNMEDVVYLKNGSIIHGMIIEQIPNQTIKIQTSDRNVFVFKTDEIEKITKEPAVGSINSKEPKKGFHEKEFGYQNIIETGFTLGVGDATASSEAESASISNDYTAIEIHDINGMKFTENIFLGIGVGFDHYFKKEEFMPEANFIPLFLDFRGYLPSSGNASCFFGTDIGYAIGITKSTNTTGLYSYYTIEEKYDFKGGFLINPSVGVKTRLSDKSVMYFSLGYKYFAFDIDYEVTFYGTTYSYPYNTYPTTLNTKMTFKASYLNFKLGFGF